MRYNVVSLRLRDGFALLAISNALGCGGRLAMSTSDV